MDLVMNAALSRIGLEKTGAAGLAESLCILPADRQVFCRNTRVNLWIIKGEKFFELYRKFEELYNNAQVKIYEITVRILSPGHVPPIPAAIM